MTDTDFCTRLPLELIAAIFSHLPINDVWRLQVIARSWRNTLTTTELLTSALRRWETHDPEHAAGVRQLRSTFSRNECFKNHRLGKPSCLVRGEQKQRILERPGQSSFYGRYLAYFILAAQTRDGSTIYVIVRDLVLDTQYFVGPYSGYRLGHFGGCEITLSSKMLAFTVGTGKLYTLDLAQLRPVLKGERSASILSTMLRTTALADGFLTGTLHADKWLVGVLYKHKRRPESVDRITIYDHANNTVRHIAIALPELQIRYQSAHETCVTKCYRHEWYGPESTMLVNAADQTCTILHFIYDYNIVGFEVELGAKRTLHCRCVDFRGVSLTENAVPYSVQESESSSFNNVPKPSHLRLRPAGTRTDFHLTIRTKFGSPHQLVISVVKGRLDINAIHDYPSVITTAFWKDRAYMNAAGRDIRLCVPIAYASSRWKTIASLYAERPRMDRIPRPSVIQDILINESYLVLVSRGRLHSIATDILDIFTYDGSLHVPHSQELLSEEQRAENCKSEDPHEYYWSDKSAEMEICICCGRAQHE